MLRIEQFEDNLFIITVDTETVKFSGLFKQIDGMETENLIPCKNGMQLYVK